jgi:hypothetical protein
VIAHALLAALAIGFSGAALVAIGLPRREGDAAFRFVVALALGIGVWAASAAGEWFVFGAHGSWAKDAIIAIVGAAAWRLARSREAFGAAPGALPSPRWLLGLFAFACVLCGLVYLEHTHRFPDGGWDAWMTWNLRARFLHRDPQWHDAFSPHMLFWARQEYPWLLPGLVGQLFDLFGESYSAPALAGFAFGSLACAVLVLALRGRDGVLAGLALLSTPCFVVFAANQQSDVPAALWLLLATVLLQKRSPWLAGFAAGLGVWTKYEGAVWAACLVVGLLLVERRSLLPFLFGALPGVALLALFKLQVHLPGDFASGSPLARALEPQRWLQLGVYALRRIFYFQAWALWLVALIVALGLTWRKLARSATGIALLLALPSIAGIYLLQAFPLEWIFRTSIDRLVIQLWPSAILLTLPALPRATPRT